MLAEREILLAILKGTRGEESPEVESIFREVRAPRALVLETLNRLCEVGLLGINGNRIIASGEQRLRIAIKLLSLGSDIERVAGLLTWSEFERFSRRSLEMNDFKVTMNFRFKWFGKWWEVDLIGVKRPIVLSADCKHWRRGWCGTASAEAARDQVERTRALADASRRLKSRLGIGGWDYAHFVPVVFSLHPSQYKFYEGTPIVPILQINDFLQNLVVHLNEITHFYVQYV